MSHEVNVSPSSPTPAAILLAGLLTAGACGDTAALDLHLVPDPNITSREQLVQLLDSVELVVDAPGGLYPASAARRAGELVIEDVDEDGDAELLASAEVHALGRLPLLRLERGGLPRADGLELRLAGVPRDGGSRRVAAGGVQGASFAGDEVVTLEIPFNIRPRYRPPQVTQSVPADGARDIPVQQLGSVFVFFSKRMDAESLRADGVFRVTRVDAAGEVEIPPREIVIQFLPGEDGPTTAEYRFDEQLGEGTYRISVSTAAVDGFEGLHLDQVAMKPGDQPFVSQFSLVALSAQVPATCPAGVTCAGEWCSRGGEICPDGMRCNAGEARCEPASCPAECAPTFICQRSSLVCVPDCRLYGSFGGCAAQSSCNPRSGLCEPR